MHNISILSLHVLYHFSTAPFYLITHNERPTVSFIYNSRFSRYFSNIVYSNTQRHSTMINKNSFSHMLDTPLIFSQDYCPDNSKCCIGSNNPFTNGQFIKDLTITNESFPSNYLDKNAFFEGGCGNLTITNCQFLYCYTSSKSNPKHSGGGIRVEQDCEVILHSCIFDNCHSFKHGGAASITQKFVVNEYTDESINKKRLEDPAHIFTNKLDIQYTCFESCYSEEGNNYGTALILGAQEVKFYYASTVDCPKAGTNKPYGAQFDIQANSISSQFINATGGESVYCGAMEYRNATKGFFQFQTIAQMHCKYAIAFTSVEINDLKITSCNIFNNTVLRDPVYDSNLSSSAPSLIFIRKKNLLVQNFYFTKNDLTHDGKLASIEIGDTLTVNLLGCYADTNNKNHWEYPNVTTENCGFHDVEITTFGLRQLKLGRCLGDVDPGPIIITNFFTPSNPFSYSKEFSKTEGFTETERFSKSSAFTESRTFTPSLNWNQSKFFTASKSFTPSSKFSKSSDFTKSNLFSETADFTKSTDFSRSNFFSKSSDFTKSSKFSKSNLFSETNDFTQTDTFTKTKAFSSSFEFTNSNPIEAPIVDRDPGNSESTKKDNKGTIIGTVVGSVAAAAIIAGLIVFFVLRKKRMMIPTDGANVMDETNSSVTVDNNLQSVMDKDDPFAADFDQI